MLACVASAILAMGITRFVWAGYVHNLTAAFRLHPSSFPRIKPPADRISSWNIERVAIVNPAVEQKATVGINALEGGNGDEGYTCKFIRNLCRGRSAGRKLCPLPMNHIQVDDDHIWRHFLPKRQRLDAISSARTDVGFGKDYPSLWSAQRHDPSSCFNWFGRGIAQFDRASVSTKTGTLRSFELLFHRLPLSLHRLPLQTSKYEVTSGRGGYNSSEDYILPVIWEIPPKPKRCEGNPYYALAVLIVALYCSVCGIGHLSSSEGNPVVALVFLAIMVVLVHVGISLIEFGSPTAIFHVLYLGEPASAFSYAVAAPPCVYPLPSVGPIQCA